MNSTPKGFVWRWLRDAVLLVVLCGLWSVDRGRAFGSEDTHPLLTGTLLYSHLTDRTWQIWETDLASGTHRQLTTSPGDKRNPSWAGNDRFTFQTSNDACFLRQHDLDDRAPFLRPLWPIKDIAWAPDGLRVVFSRLRTDLADSANLWTANAEGRAIQQLTQEPGLQINPAWSPDGAWVAFIAGRGYGTYDLFVMRQDGGERRQLTHDHAQELSPAWSPDGTLIAFSSDKTGDAEIWLIRADGSGARQLTDSPGLDTHPAWSPDGRFIAFTSNRSGRLEVWVMRSDGSEPRPLEQAQGGACDPAWGK